MSAVQQPRARPRPPERVVAVVHGVASVDGPVLYWPDCGHPLADHAVLYDRPVCVACDSG